MSRSIHNNLNTSVGDYHFFKMESAQDGDVKMLTDNGFHFIKPVKCEAFIIDNFRVIKHNEKLVIQKKVGDGNFNTIFLLE
jgi:hypothetical protein